MKKSKLFSLLIIVAFLIGSSISFSACNGDDDDNSKPTDKYLGSYSLQSATFVGTDTLFMIIADTAHGIDSMNFFYAPGADLTGYVMTALFNDSPCQNPLSTRITLKDDMQAAFTCSDDTSSLPMGAWSLNASGDALTISYTAMGMDIIISNPVLNTTTNLLSGTILFPFPIDARSPITLTNLQFQSVDVVFDKTE